MRNRCGICSQQLRWTKTTQVGSWSWHQSVPRPVFGRLERPNNSKSPCVVVRWCEAGQARAQLTLLARFFYGALLWQWGDIILFLFCFLIANLIWRCAERLQNAASLQDCLDFIRNTFKNRGTNFRIKNVCSSCLSVTSGWCLLSKWDMKQKTIIYNIFEQRNAQLEYILTKSCELNANM